MTGSAKNGPCAVVEITRSGKSTDGPNVLLEMKNDHWEIVGINSDFDLDGMAAKHSAPCLPRPVPTTTLGE